MSTRICVFGASTTWGAGDNEYGGWVSRLRSYFETNHDDYNLRFYNMGISGDSSEDLLKRFEPECKARQPKIIIISIGSNDSLYINSKDNPNVTLEKFQSNLNEIINQAKNFTDKIIFVGLTKIDESKTMPIPWDKTKFYDNENIIKYNSAAEKICQKYNIAFINLLDLLNLEDLNDGLHPSPHGHKKMFLAIKKFLQTNNIIFY